MKPTPEQIEKASGEASQAFWASIAKSFPEAKTGDLDPVSCFRIDEAMNTAVTQWVEFNFQFPPPNVA